MFDDRENARHSIAYRDWFLRVFCWDGALPVVVVLAPIVAKRLLPNLPGIIELLAIVLPIAALFSRFIAGSRVIRSNHCADSCRQLQFVALAVALVILVLIDAVLILSHNMPAGALFAVESDRIVWTILAAVYLTNMLFAMYPGRAPGGPNVRTGSATLTE
ncbi:MAG: hypothetical protein ACM3U2_05910 [Deltaproteobacteria bacterium]